MLLPLLLLALLAGGPSAAVAQTLANSGGPILWQPIQVHIVWVGSFSNNQRAAIQTFLSSLPPPSTYNLSQTGMDRGACESGAPSRIPGTRLPWSIPATEVRLAASVA